MHLLPIPAFSDNYIWLLIDDSSLSVLCVDPGDAVPVIAYLKAHSLTLEVILLTHHHYDHINGVDDLLNHYPNALVHAPDDARIMLATKIPANTPIKWHNYQFEVLAIPGHTSTHCAFYEPNFHILFCGDTLFSAGCGRVFDGSRELLYASLNTLKQLPNATKIYCGHEYTRQNLRFAATVEPDNQDRHEYYQQLLNAPTSCSLPSTIELEKRINPFWRLEVPDVIEYAKSQGCKTRDAFSVFKQLRLSKDNFQ